MENSFAPTLFAKNSQSLISKAARKHQHQQKQKQMQKQKSTVQLSNKEARETNGKMNFVCRRSWPPRPALCSQVSHLILILLLALALLESPAESWRFFDMTNAESRSFGILHPTTNSMLIQNSQAPINLPSSNQLITPSTGGSQTSGALSLGNIGGENDITRNSNSNEVNQQESKAGFLPNTERIDNDGAPTGLSSPLVTNSKISTVDSRSDLARDASLLSGVTDSLVSQAVDATKASHSDQQQQDDNQPPTRSDNNPAASVVPSPAGKIISPLLSAAANSAQNSSSSFESGAKQLNAAFQLLKPRKHSSQDANRQLASAEQQIINQHARVHSVGNSHQRFFPTKQRDHKINAAINDSPPNTDNTESEPFSLLGNFRLGISNRNSIVKAISDNKLARTLSTVGKSISGNKYIVGAAAASALAAALGLGMSKLLSPYLMSGGYSKIADPMMSSGTVLNPSMVSYPMDGARTDPSFLYANPADSMFASASSQQAYLRPQQLSGSYSSDTLDPMSIYETAPTSAVLQQPPATSGLYQTNAYSGLLNSQSSSSEQQPQQQIYFTYKPTTIKPPQIKHQHLRPTTSSSSQSASTDAGGHYTNFYDQQGMTSPDQLSSSPTQYESSYSSSYEPSLSTSLSSLSSPPPPSSISTASSTSPLQAYSSSRYLQNQANLNPASSVAQIDQMMPAASIDSPVFPSSQQRQSNTFGGRGASVSSGTTGELFDQAYPFMPTLRHSSNFLSTPRRSGTVALKMDEATRNRLIQTILQQQMLMPGIGNEFGSNSATVAGYSAPGDKLSTNKPAFDSFVPITTTALTDVFASPTSEYASGAAKSSRAESGGNKNQYASSKSNKPQQGELVPKTSPAVAYTLLYPKINQPGSFDGSRGERQKDIATTTETNSAKLSLSQQQIQQQARQSPWRSFDGETQQQKSQSQQTQAWQSLEGTSKQTSSSGDNRIDQQQQQQWQLPKNDDQQVSQVVANGQDGGSSVNSVNANGQQQQEVPLQRVSRTPNQSSVIQAWPSALATGVAVTESTTTPNNLSRQHTPIESLTDYESEMSNGANVGVVRSSSSSQSSLGAAEHTNGQNFASTSEGAASASKTNLILQLEESDKNNDIKLIEPNTKGSGKLASLAVDSVSAVPANRVSYIPRNEDKIALAASDNGQRQQKHHRNHHQQASTN